MTHPCSGGDPHFAMGIAASCRASPSCQGTVDGINIQTPEAFAFPPPPRKSMLPCESRGSPNGRNKSDPRTPNRRSLSNIDSGGRGAVQTRECFRGLNIYSIYCLELGFYTIDRHCFRRWWVMEMRALIDGCACQRAVSTATHCQIDESFLK